MNTLTDKQLEILVELLRGGKKIGIPDLREKLIQKGISVHINEVRQTVAKLEKMKLINVERIPIGKKEYYRLSPKSDYESFKKVGKHLLDSNKRFDFIRSKYVQSVINEEFVNHFAAEWWKECVDFFKERLGERYDYYKKASAEKMRDKFYSKLGIKKDEFIQMLRLSPSTLHTFLFPEDKVPSLGIDSNIKCFSRYRSLWTCYQSTLFIKAGG